jgi:hypothetical protein
MPRLLPLLIISGILLLIDFYAFQAIRTVMTQSDSFWKRAVTIAYWSITAITIASIVYFFFFDFYSVSKWIRVYLVSTLFVFYVPKLILNIFLLLDDSIRLGKWTVSLFNSPASGADAANAISRSQFLAQAGLLVGGFFLFQFIYGMVRTAYNYQVRRVKIPVKNLPEVFNGFRIVQISDIHTGSFTSDAPLREAVKLVNEQQADAIFFTGDLVNNRSDEALDFVEALKELKSTHGVYSIFGNHDYGDYHSWKSPEQKAENLAALEDIHARMGWKLLRNEHAIISKDDEQMAVLGVDNWSAVGRFPQYGDLKKALQGTENAAVKLLLSHDPSHWKGQVLADFPDVAITFSGHTHGFQFGFEIPGLKWSPAKYMYPEWAGLYRQGSQSLYVNRGLGFLGYSGRVGIAPEITVAELVRA